MEQAAGPDGVLISNSSVTSCSDAGFVYGATSERTRMLEAAGLVEKTNFDGKTLYLIIIYLEDISKKLQFT